MKSHGLIFSAPMVRAMLAGIKTETRRLNPRKIEVGDTVWCKETHQLNSVAKVLYAADYTKSEYASMKPWRSPLFLPEELSRLQGVVSSVRIERLHDITEAGAADEGIGVFWDHTEGHYDVYGRKTLNAIQAYFYLIDHIHRAEIAHTNPEVQVISWAKVAP